MMGVSSGLSGIRQTLHFMRQYVNEYKTHPQVRELALSLVRNLPQKDFDGEVDRVFRFVQNRIRYIRDIHEVETIQTPVKTLEYGQGDCDDKATLLAAMLQSLGHPTRFHAMGFRPGHISHVLLEVKKGHKWVSLDATEPVHMGWTPPAIKESIYVRNG